VGYTSNSLVAKYQAQTWWRRISQWSQTFFRLQRGELLHLNFFPAICWSWGIVLYNDTQIHMMIMLDYASLLSRATCLSLIWLLGWPTGYSSLVHTCCGALPMQHHHVWIKRRPYRWHLGYVGRGIADVAKIYICSVGLEWSLESVNMYAYKNLKT